MKKKLCALLLAFALTLGLLPAAALAAEEGSITVYVTISDTGTLVTGKDGTRVAYAPVTVTDQNQSGTFDVDDVLRAAHQQCYSGGGEGYGSYTGYYGLSLAKLWGDESGNFGYLVDNSYVFTDLTQAVAAGAHVVAFIYEDTLYYSDRYGYFDQPHAVVPVGGDLDLTLYCGNGTPVANAGVSVIEPVPSEPQATDGAGKVTLRFEASGTYLISADCTVRGEVVTDWMTGQTQEVDCPVVPPVCRAEVLSAEDYARYQVLEQAAGALTWDSFSDEEPNAVTTGLALPGTLTVDGGKTVEVTWSCDDVSGALSVYGTYAYVSRPLAQDAACILTATLDYDGKTAKKVFSVAVKAEGVTEEKESVSDYAALMDGIAATYTASTDAWTVLDMAAYGKDIRDGGYGGSSAAPAAMAEAALGGTPDLSGLTDFDVSGPYAIYSAPYVLLAYDAAGADDSAFVTKRSDLKDSMTAYLGNLSGNYADTDEVTPILAALAPYYHQGDAGLDTAVDSAVTWLSQRQNPDGTFSYYGTKNANSTALAVVALAALGIDAHTDARFVKEQSAVDGLFSFALPTLDGLGYQGNVTKNTLATEQGFRALVAYARFAERGGAYNIYLDADVTAAAPAAPKISATVPVEPENSGGSGGTITVTFSLTGDRVHYDPDTDTYTGSHSSPTWIPTTAIHVPAGSTVKYVTHMMLEDAGLDYVSNGSYISEINGLAEFDNGPYSGWMYRHNGLIADEGYADRVLENGDTLRWFYTDDYLSETNYEGNWDSINKAIRDQRAADQVIELIKAIGEVTRNSGAAIRAARKAYDALTGDQQKLVTNYDVLLAAEAAYAKLTAVLPFTDVAEDYWALEAIRYVYELGLMNGTSSTTFSPEKTTSRGMIVTILYRLEGSPAVARSAGFCDVAGDLYCADAVEWAAANGIAGGYGGGLFGPNDPITREQLAVILYRYAAFKGYDVSARADLGWFADVDRIGSWFLDAMKWANAEGLISGRENNLLDPQGRATRAQVAVILMRYLENLAK